MAALERKLGDEIERHAKRIVKAENGLYTLRDLTLLAQGGGKLLDIITKHVIDSGFSSKTRELRAEFLTKTEFKAAEGKFLSRRHLDELERVITAKVSA